MQKPIILVVGGNYGSEGKGNVVGQLCVERKVDIAVRTGAINAGHTVFYNGRAFKMQQIPVGWVNPNTKLVIGAGAYVHIPTLLQEVAWINEAMPKMDVRNRLIIDARAGLHTDAHHAGEKGLHERMGSTGEGCMEAAVDKMRRSFEYKRFSETEEARQFAIGNTAQILNDSYDAGAQILIEGTQGTMLDFHLGTYPYVTSRQTFASAWAAECGLSPSLEYDVVMVVRAYPIRVAGNSGPFPQEINWVDFAREINAKRVHEGMKPLVGEADLKLFEQAVSDAANELKLPTATPELTMGAIERKKYSTQISQLHQLAFSKLDPDVVMRLKKLFEFTTVTKKLRRLARLDKTELQYAAQLNRPREVVLTFFDYEFPELAHAKTWTEIEGRPGSDEYRKYIRRIEDITRARVSYVGTEGDGIVKVR